MQKLHAALALAVRTEVEQQATRRSDLTCLADTAKFNAAETARCRELAKAANVQPE